MVIQRLLTAVSAIGLLALIVAFAMLSGLIPPPTALLGTPDNYEHSQVAITDQTNETIATVNVRIADTSQKRYTGLSNTSSLNNSSGMLFSYNESSDHTYVMRGMDFPLDIIFIDSDGQINSIKSAPAPGPNEDGNNIRRSGSGQYVLEVPRGWAKQHDIHVNHSVSINN